MKVTWSVIHGVTLDVMRYVVRDVDARYADLWAEDTSQTGYCFMIVKIKCNQWILGV